MGQTLEQWLELIYSPTDYDKLYGNCLFIGAMNQCECGNVRYVGAVLVVEHTIEHVWQVHLVVQCPSYSCPCRGGLSIISCLFT